MSELPIWKFDEVGRPDIQTFILKSPRLFADKIDSWEFYAL